MPLLSYFAIVGSALVALLFAADITLPKSAPVIATSSIYGMPKPWHPDPTQTLASTPAPAPDMSSEAVLAAAPSTAAKTASKTEPVNERSATIDVAPKKKRVVARRAPPDDSRQNYAWSRSSDPFRQDYAWSRNSDPFARGGTFGRF